MHLMERERRFYYTLTQRNDVICNQGLLEKQKGVKICHATSENDNLKLQILHIRWTIQEPSKLEFLQFIINFVVSRLQEPVYYLLKIEGHIILKFLLT